jgi:hypothetical protein
VSTPGRLAYAYDRGAAWKIHDHVACTTEEGFLSVKYGLPELAEQSAKASLTATFNPGGVLGTLPPLGWSNIIVPGKRNPHLKRFAGIRSHDPYLQSSQRAETIASGLTF